MTVVLPDLETDPVINEALDVDMPCDVVRCESTATWIVIWRRPGCCTPSDLYCDQHANRVMEALRDPTSTAHCRHRVLGRLRDWVLRIEPL